ncbi:MAG: hypothetical protein IJ679_13245 [Lachnospiraceae bacterium]|nr:hypothetical protein [Lachnospiraceae bacterium]
MTKLYISFAADIIAIVLIICQLVHIKKHSDEKEAIGRYFGRFSGIVLFISVLHLLKTYADLSMGVITQEDFGKLSGSEEALWYWIQIAAGIIDIFLSTVFLYMWISFLSWYLYQDKDFIRRKFWAGFAPLIITAAVSCVSIPMALRSQWGFWFFIAAICVAFVVRVFYFWIAFRLLRDYKIQNGYLRFFNPYAFFVPVALSWLIQDFSNWGVGALGTTIGVVLLYISIIEKRQYMEPETGLYNMDFVGYLQELADKNKYAPQSAMIFTLDASKDMIAFSEILKKQLPTDCEPIARSSHEVVVFTKVRERGPLAMVVEDVKALSEVGVDYTLKKKDETTKAFMGRVL